MAYLSAIKSCGSVFFGKSNRTKSIKRAPKKLTVQLFTSLITYHRAMDFVKCRVQCFVLNILRKSSNARDLMRLIFFLNMIQIFPFSNAGVGVCAYPCRSCIFFQACCVPSIRLIDLRFARPAGPPSRPVPVRPERRPIYTRLSPLSLPPQRVRTAPLPRRPPPGP